MKKSYLALALCLTFSVSCSSCDKKPEDKQHPKSYNDKLIDALAAAYAEFEATDTLPASITVEEGTVLNKGEYYEAACRLLAGIGSGVSDDIAVTGYKVPSHPTVLDTFRDDVVGMDLIKDNAERQLKYAGANGNVFSNYCLYPNATVGSYQGGRLSFTRGAVILARVFAGYARNGRLPENVSSWPSDYKRSAAHCDITSPTVQSAAATATQGRNTALEQAQGIFVYARDELEYEYYSDTRYGAEGTLTDKQGNCCDLSHAIVAMARATGLPARYIHGNCTFKSGVIGHVWAEIYADGKWYVCDASNNGNTFGNHENWSSCELLKIVAELPF